MSTKLWLAPSGRLHWLKHCSGSNHMLVRRVTLNDKELAKMSWPEQICRCAINARDEAGLRIRETNQ